MVEADRRVTVAPRAGPPAAVEQARRPVFVHYHLFKNAGTSLDRMLRAQFGSAWATHEGDGPLWPAADVQAYLRRQTDVVVLSSHTALLSCSPADDLAVQPIMFLRHPLDRARSVYEFERRQQINTEGAQQAKALSLPEYVEWRLARPRDRTLRNFQVHRLQFGSSDGDTEWERARATLRRLPFIGLVEHFDESTERLQRWMTALLPGTALPSPPVPQANRTQPAGQSLDDRLHILRRDLGQPLYRRLLDANREDLRIHQAVSRRYAAANAAEAAG
jgi:hypothetical protein